VLDEEPVWPSIDIPYDTDPARLGERARLLLDVGLDEQRSWHDASGYTPLRVWVDAIESLGILVVQDGSVPLDQMRGFAAIHEAVPAIVLNTKDDARARAFTAVHELGHLLRVGAGQATGATTETWCNEFAGAVIAPRAAFAADFASSGQDDLVAMVDALALHYGLTPLAAAVRVARLSLAPQDQVDEVIRRIGERPHRQPGEGGNYYRTMIGRNSPSFVQLVFNALDSQLVSYPEASGLLGVKVNYFEKLRTYAAERMSRR
jgi:Zn-dependent peptidase ImmA (M78 family)